MKTQNVKVRKRKQVVVYERGYELFPMIGELDVDQLESCGLVINEAKSKHMQEVMKMVIREVMLEFAPLGVSYSDELKEKVNSISKDIFSNIARSFDFNSPFNRELLEITQADIWGMISFVKQCEQYESQSPVEYEEDYSYT